MMFVACGAMFALGAASFAMAHPHMWIGGSFGLTMDRQGLAAVQVTWEMDAFNSADLIYSYDLDDDRRISAAESRDLHDNAFQHLRNVGYFIQVSVAGQGVDLPEAREFQASIRGDRMIYRFTLPVEVDWAIVEDVGLAMFDQSYFIQFSVDEARVVRNTAQTVRVTREVLAWETDGWGTVEVAGVRLTLG